MNRWLKQHSSQATAKEGDWSIICADFFTYVPEATYDLIYDYTYVPSQAYDIVDLTSRFLCAIPPTLRQDWAKQMKALSSPSSTTRLVTLMFPLPLSPDAPAKEGGPPFELKETDYHELLDGDWELIHFKKLGDKSRPSGGPAGQALGVWKRR
jgi:hypothetical protein